MTYCLDTNIVIDLWRGDESLRKILSTLSKEEIYITPITLCELFKGAYLSSNVEYDLQLINKFIDRTNVLNFTSDACHEFGKEFAKLQKSGKTTEELDLMIACIAKVHGLTVVTRNKKHFENIGVDIEVW